MKHLVFFLILIPLLATCQSPKPDLSGLPTPLVMAQPIAVPCPKIDDWGLGAQADAANAMAPLAASNQNVAHLIEEWARLRADAKACNQVQQ